MLWFTFKFVLKIKFWIISKDILFVYAFLKKYFYDIIFYETIFVYKTEKIIFDEHNFKNICYNLTNTRAPSALLWLGWISFTVKWFSWKRRIVTKSYSCVCTIIARNITFGPYWPKCPGSISLYERKSLILVIEEHGGGSSKSGTDGAT